MENKRVGIMTLYFNYNYGAVLQAYSLQKVIRNYRYEAKDIRYHRKVDYVVSEISVPYEISFSQRMKIWIKLLFTGGGGRLLLHKIAKRIREHSLKYRDIKRKKLFDKFIHDNIDECFVPKDGGINKLNDMFDVFVCGSDNIWNPNLFDGRFMLNFVNDDKLKIAYAPGMSVENLSHLQEIIYKQNACRFDAISCREKSGAKILKQLIEKDVFVALDPTLLITVEEWGKLEKTIKKKRIPEKYAICYFCEYHYYTDDYIKQLEQLMKIPFIAVPNMFGKINLTSKNLIRLWDTGPSEFLYLFRNSTFVLTDSFHGTVFAIQYKKPFLNFRRFFDQKNKPLNYRVDNLLEVAGIDNKRIIEDSGQNVEELLLAPINWDSVNKNILSHRKNSLQFLAHALAIQKNG